MESLKANQIPAVVYYRQPVHLAKACQHLGYQAGDFPAAEKASQEVLSLPFHPYLTSDQVLQVTDCFKAKLV